MASDVWVCESSTGFDCSIRAISGSRFLRASMARLDEPMTRRESSGPSPPTAVYDSSITVFRFSCGIACRPVVAAASKALMSGGTELSASAITSPSFSGGEAALWGSNSTYVSPIADWLCTSALKSDGIGLPDVGGAIQPGGLRQLHLHGVAANTEQHRRQFHEVQRHHGHRDERDHGKDDQLDLDPSIEMEMHLRPLVPVGGTCQWITGGIAVAPGTRAWELADSAAPLQL